jgi:lipoyl(octanoyl) transferase
VTYHGPGQLVGYPVRRVDHRGVRAHVRGMTEAIIDELRARNVEATWTDEAPGVWTPKGKIAAVGVDAHGSVAIHGFSLNVDPDLADYSVIVPCGLGAPVTSLAAHGVDPLPSLQELAACLAVRMARNYAAVAREIAPEALFPSELARADAVRG